MMFIMLVVSGILMLGIDVVVFAVPAQRKSGYWFATLLAGSRESNFQKSGEKTEISKIWETVDLRGKN